MRFNKSSKLAFILTLFIVILPLNSCKLLQNLFHPNPKKKPIRQTQTFYNPYQKRPQAYHSPEQVESQALSLYKSARIFESQYYETDKTDYAKIAIEKLTQYYNLQPTGTYAGLTLLRIAELSYRIGDLNRANFEIRRIKSRPELRIQFKDEIELIEKLINQ